MKKLQLALIGAGGIGKIWAEAAKKAEGITFRTVVDTDLKKAADLAALFDDCRTTNNWKVVLEDKEINGAVVATPHCLLSPISKGFLEARKHVLSEKPGGVNSEEIKQNTELAERNNLVYMIGFVHRFHPAFILAKKIFDEGKIGRVLFIRGRYGFGGRAGYEKEWRFQKKISGGGELIDQGMHLVDMSRWFMGEFEEIKGFAENLFWGGDVEDNGFVVMRTGDRRVAQIHVSWTNWEWVHSFEIYGESGYLDVEGLDQRYRGPEKLIFGRLNPRAGELPKEEITVFNKEQKTDSFSRELTAFRDAIFGTGNKIPTGQDAYEALKIVEKVYAQNE